MFGLVSLGFTLSLDNVRTSFVLGGLKPDLAYVGQDIPPIFGLWTGFARAAGLLLGNFLSDRISATADRSQWRPRRIRACSSSSGLGAPEHADPDLRWARPGCPSR